MTWLERLGGIGDEAALGIADQIAVHRELGWRYLELRTVDGVALADLPPDRITGIAGMIADAGLQVPCLDSRIGSWARPITCSFDGELTELDALLRAAEVFGTRYIRVMSYPNDGLPEPDWAAETIRRLRLLAHRAAERGAVLVHENCSGWAGTSADRALTLLSEVDGPGLRLLYDTGNPVAHGYDGPAYLAKVLPWVVHVHIKDGLPPAPPDRPSPLFTAPGEGVAELSTCLDMLRRHGYSGVFSVEPHVAVSPHTHARAAPEVVRARYLDYGRRLATWLEASP